MYDGFSPSIGAETPLTGMYLHVTKDGWMDVPKSRGGVDNLTSCHCKGKHMSHSSLPYASASHA